MVDILIFSTGVILGTWIGWRMAAWSRSSPDSEGGVASSPGAGAAGDSPAPEAPADDDTPSQNASADDAGNLAGHNEERESGMEENKRRILEAIAERGEIVNNDVEELLGVSDATATRYLNALEADGKIEQVGDTGRSVSYRLK